MTLKTVPVTGILYNPNGSVSVGTSVVATLTVMDTDGGVVVPTQVSATTDSTGSFTLNLWPNARGVNGSQYRVRANIPGALPGYLLVNVLITVPDSDPSVPIPIATITNLKGPDVLSDSKAALLAMQGYVVQNLSSVTLAQNWAQYIGGDVPTVPGSRSSRGWAQDDLRNTPYGGSAKDWAIGLATIDGTHKSAQGYALDAQAAQAIAQQAQALAQTAVSIPSAAINVTSIAGIQALVPSSLPVILNQSGREGYFLFDSTNHWNGRHSVSAYDVNVTVVPDSVSGGYLVTKVAGGGAWNASAMDSVALSGDFEIWFQRVGTSNGTMIGVDHAPAASSTYTDIDFAINWGTGSGQAYENGAKDTNGDWTWANALNWLCMKRVGSTIYAYENTNDVMSITGATLKHTFTGVASGAMYMKSTTYGQGDSFRVVVIDVSGVGTGFVQADTAQGVYVPPSSDTTGHSGAWVRLLDPARRVAVPWFGELTTGNNTTVFQSLTRYSQSQTGCVASLRPNKTYTVGQQTLGGDPANYSYAPANILSPNAFSGRLVIEGNGATLLADPSLRLGSFDPTTGAVYNPPSLPFSDTHYLATPYVGMIDAESFDTTGGSLEVENLTLNGNVTHLTLGGYWGDTGYQVINAGMQLLNVGPVKMVNVKSMYHGTDGCTYRANIAAKGNPAIPAYFLKCQFHYNGRNGFSLTGGKGVLFELCSFSHTGMNGVVDSNPHAGIDIEPDGGLYAMDVTFLRCEFVNNAGVGYGGGSGRISDINFYGCHFSGDNSFTHTVFKPGHLFDNCTFIGISQDTSTDVYNNGILEDGRATTYRDCLWSDDPVRTYNGTTVYGTGAASQFGGNVRFQRCTWDHSRGLIGLPSIGGSESVEMTDCTFIHPTAGVYQVNGVNFFGITQMIGPGSLGAEGQPWRFHGRYIKNGVEQFTGTLTPTWSAIAAGGTASFAVTVPLADVTDQRVYQAHGMTGAGALVRWCEVSSGAVTVHFYNPTAGAITPAGTITVVGTR